MRRFAVRGLMALLASLILCGCSGKWEDYEKTLGYRGRARVNPFLAAERLLDELGHDAHGAKSLTKMPSHDAVILVSGENGLPEGRARQLLRWTFSGGHLIYCLGGTRPYNDFETQYGSFIAAMLLEEEKDPVLEQLGVGVQKRLPDDEIKELAKDMLNKEGVKDSKKAAPPAKKDETKKDDTKKKKKQPEDDEDEEAWLESVQEVTWNGQTYKLSLGGYQHLILKRKLRSGEFSAGSKNESLALHLNHGMGSVTLLAHARPFRNRWIGERDHARWLSALVGEHGSKEVLFVAATTGSFMALLWQHGWMALVVLALCLIFWLWQQMPRFGPLAEVELDSTRHFASHIGALGEFFWRMRRGALLVNAARDAVWERVRERHRSLDDGSRKMNDHLAEEIARRAGLPVKRVAAAFDVAPPESAHNFVTLMRDLQAIRRAL
ncbi:DUF4350 domain-containing protein [Prosthecobacter sp.]|uniref:DUF4350 domain-containing protein n=1 Tax=Prosthecobacter sp. TaxID=1965333 RepID=UPI002ABC7216|nr:DUF4350 domain-containing protein [Prosthecobacter sp.]MDZ4403950.1 DUF4350 domain-containing protein [Prosthecobacter sp.]